MNSEIFNIIIINILTIVLAIPLGKYIGKIFNHEKTFLDPIFNPIENRLFQWLKITKLQSMTWQEHFMALISLNGLWFLMSMFTLMNMSWLPFNPDHMLSMKWDLAFNTTVSFITNTNLQHYSGEQSLSYLGQITLMLWQFISAASGLAICIVVFYAMKEKGVHKLGNFYAIFTKSLLRILLPLAFIIALILIFNKVPMTFSGKINQITLEGKTQHISTGPVAAFEAIKQLGTNGGGFFGANAAHPLENPNIITNDLENIAILIIPIAMIFAMGSILRKRKMAWMIFGIMSIGYYCLLIPSIQQEVKVNPKIQAMGISNSLGNMEGKEMRIGSVTSANWAISTTCTSNGSVNAMHDSMMPLTGMFALLGMMMNCFYGGIGVGFLNFYIFIILAVFISGLMVGRTPEFLGKKIEAKEMQIAMMIALLHPFLILVGTALASYLFTTHPEMYQVWLKNPGYHGFSEILYEFTSSSANNGSGFEGLNDNNPFWNISTGIIMLLARYLPILGPLAIAGILAKKKYIPESNGTLKTDSLTFGVMIMAVILIVAALSFFPTLTLGPIAEHFTLFSK